MIVFLVKLKMGFEIFDPRRQYRDLHLRGSGVSFMCGIGLHERLLVFPFHRVCRVIGIKNGNPVHTPENRRYCIEKPTKGKFSIIRNIHILRCACCQAIQWDSSV